MNGKRKQPKDNVTTDENVWTETDQIRLEALMDNGSINSMDTVAKVKTLDERFEKFSTRVLGSHLGRVRKAKYLSEALSSSNLSTSPVSAGLNQTVPTPVSAGAGDPSKSPDATDECDSLICRNLPFLRFTYFDANHDREKVVILLDLPGGSTNYEWDFNDSADGIVLRVEWSSAFSNVRSMFDSVLNTGNDTLDDPKLRAMQDILQKKGISRTTIPKCCIQVSLGVKVCKEDDAWETTAIQHEGNKILMMEFSEFREKQTFKKMKRGNFASE